MENILKRIYKIQLQWILLLVGLINFSFQSLAGEISQTDYVDKSAIVATVTTLRVYDNTVIAENLHPTWYASTRKHQVRLTYTREGKTDVPSLASWSYRIDYTIYVTGGTPGVYTGFLTVNHNPTASNDVYDAINEHALGFSDATIKVTAVTLTGTPPADIRLELTTITTRYTDFVLSSAPAPLIMFNSTTSELTWGYVPGAEEYDVEWTFIDYTDAHTGVIFNLPNDPFDYKTPIRVTTSSQYYLIDQVFPKGTLYYRVRPTGRFIAGVGTDYTHVSYGTWGYSTTLGGLAVSFVVTSSFESNKNWGYTAVYAEEGKSKKGIGYSDGGGKSRQSQATMNSDNTVIVGENKYDIEGRAVISMMPVPVDVPNPLTAFNYREKFNSTSLFQEWDYNDFQLGVTPLGDLSGAGKYYSGANGFISSDPSSQYIDDAGGAATPATHDAG